MKRKLALDKFFYLVLVQLLLFNYCCEKVYGQLSVVYRSQPFVQNFTKGQYGAGNQNWSIAQDNNGILYFGNNYGLLEFNGADWNLHTDPDFTNIRSVFADSDGKIYTGSYEEFGYWQRNSYGELVYTSISQELLNHEDIANTAIWRIFRIDENVYLHSFSKIFIYNGKEINTIIESESTILPMFQYRGKPYVSILDSGLFYIDKDFKLVKESSPDFMMDLRIQNMFEINDDTSVVFTENNGIYLKTGVSLTQPQSPDNLLLSSYHINRIIRISDRQFAIGTIKQGVLITDYMGNIHSRLDKSNGLQNNAVTALLKDPDNNLWIGLQKGIDFTQIASPFFIIADETGKLGSVYCSVKYKNRIYLGTNHGLFYADWVRLINRENTEFVAVTGLEGHVMSLDIIDDQLICGFNQGTYNIDGNRTIKLSDIGGGNLLVNPFNSNIGYQGIYTGVAIYEKNNSGIWNFSKVIYEGSETNYLEMDHEGNLWASSTYRGLQLHQLNKSGDSIFHTVDFGENDGFVTDDHINVFKFGNGIVFSNGGSFFTYDYPSKKIVPYKWLNDQTGIYASSYIIYEESPTEYWFIGRSSLGHFHYSYDSLMIKYEIKNDLLNISTVEYSENISRIDEGYYAIGLVDGFAILDYSLVSDSIIEYPLHNIQINKFECINKDGIAQMFDLIPSSKHQIPFRNRNLNVHFSVPGTSQELLTFYYRFSDLEPWNDLGNNSVLRYNNLNQGSYQLEIKAVEGISGRYSALTFPFSVLPPWYLHWLAIVAYILFFIISGLVTWKIIRIRLRRQQMQYHEKIRQESEKEMADMKQEYLQRELRNKSKELVNYTILLDKRNELLQRLKSILDRELDSPDTPARELQLKLMKIIDENISNRDDWQIFKVHFDAANSDFLERLKKIHNNLTPSDLRFCGFLRMNLTSKEISSLLSISLRSIEVKRYRLRKKLSLEHEDNLIEYLMDV